MKLKNSLIIDKIFEMIKRISFPSFVVVEVIFQSWFGQSVTLYICARHELAMSPMKLKYMNGNGCG